MCLHSDKADSGSHQTSDISTTAQSVQKDHRRDYDPKYNPLDYNRAKRSQTIVQTVAAACHVALNVVTVLAFLCTTAWFTAQRMNFTCIESSEHTDGIESRQIQQTDVPDTRIP